jgi:hypothetical protein
MSQHLPELSEAANSAEQDTLWATNREVKLKRVKPAFGSKDKSRHTRKPRPEPFWKRFHRAGKQNPAKKREDTRISDHADWRQRLLRETIADLTRDFDFDQDEYFSREDEAEGTNEYFDWWNQRFAPYDRYDQYDYVDCDCPVCLGIDEDYYYLDDLDDSFWDVPILEDDPVTEVESDPEFDPVPKHAREDRQFRRKRAGKRQIARECARRKRKQSPAKQLWTHA